MGARTIVLAGSRELGTGRPALVVAEIGQNHNGRPDLAKQLVDAAAWAGADAVKFTKRDLDCELSSEARDCPYIGPHAFGATYGEHRRALELSAADYRTLVCRARHHQLLAFGTACDSPSAQLLAELGCEVIKIASRDLSNAPLLEHVAEMGRPIFLSTGMSDLAEVDAAVRTVRRQGAPLVVFQCTSLYPAPYEVAHLRSLATLAARYHTPVGFSDHTLGRLLAPVAVALGAVVIEKHITLDRRLKGTDHAVSLEPEEFRRLIADVRDVEAALGRADKPLVHEVAPIRARLGRSLVTSAPLAEGARLDESMLVLKCPGDGLAWSKRQRFIGRRAKRPLAANQKLSPDDFA